MNAKYPLILTVFLFLLFVGCDVNSGLNSSTMTLKVGVFAYAPKATESPKSVNVSFVLVEPAYAPTFSFKSYSPFSDFAKSMGSDIEQIIIARGFSIFGPYSTSDEMPYSDKKNSDIILEISIDPDVNYQNVKATFHKVYPLYKDAEFYYTYVGTAIVKGKIDLTARAVWNREMLWKKSIPLPEKSFQIASTKRYEDKVIDRAFIAGDPGVVNPFVSAFEDYYKVVMQTVDAHLDPEEMKNVKKQADEIRKNYQK